jgi:Cytosine/uracil/thiamine/allantoin permeases
VKGQILALPASMTAFAGMGVITTSAGMSLYPHMELKQLWDPITLIGNFTQPLVVAIAMFTIMLATLAVNVAANVVSPANDLANCFPKWISFKRGALITGIVGILIQPWRLIADPQAYIFKWLLGYGGGLGSIAGVMIVDYWVIRKKNLNLIDLYLLDGDYRYTNGWNLRAVLATVAGCATAWIGVVWEPARILYDYSWFVGLGTSSVVYYVLMKARK